MWTLIRNGGVLSMLFILLTGLVGLAAAFHFALRAGRKSLGFIRGMALATLFGTLAATCGDVGATLYAAADAANDGIKEGGGAPPGMSWDAKRGAALMNAARIAIEGCSESTSPGILGFSILALTSLLTAVGRRRLAEREGTG